MKNKFELIQTTPTVFELNRTVWNDAALLTPLLWIKDLSSITNGVYKDSSGNNITISAGTTDAINDSIIMPASNSQIIAALTVAGVYSTFYTNDTTPKIVHKYNIMTLSANILFYDFWNNANLLLFSQAVTGSKLVYVRALINITYPLNAIRTSTDYVNYNTRIVAHFSAYQKLDPISNPFINLAPNPVGNLGTFKCRDFSLNHTTLKPSVVTNGDYKYMDFDGTKKLISNLMNQAFFSNNNGLEFNVFFFGKFKGNLNNQKYYIFDTTDRSWQMFWGDLAGGNYLTVNGYYAGTGANGTYAGFKKDNALSWVGSSRFSTTRQLIYLGEPAPNHQIDGNGKAAIKNTYLHVGSDYQDNFKLEAEITDIFIIVYPQGGLLPDFIKWNYWSAVTGQKTLNLQCVGDSLTAGTGATVSYPTVLQNLLTPYRKHRIESVINGGIGGIQMTTGTNHQMSATRIATVNSYLKSDTSLFYNLLIVWGDWCNTAASITKEELYNNTKTYVTGRKADGWNVINILPQPMNNGAYEVNRQYLIYMEKNEFPALGIPCIDITNDPYIGVSTCQTDHPEYWTDGLHMNDLGYARVVNTYVYPFLLANGYLNV